MKRINLIIFLFIVYFLRANEYIEIESKLFLDRDFGRKNWLEAISICEKLNLKLVSKIELREAYDNISQFKNINKNDWFWSNNEIKNYKIFIWTLGFFNGYDLITNKKDLASVLCIK